MLELTVQVSQFTLLARTDNGLKPSFHGAMDPVLAKELYERFVTKVGEAYEKQKVKNGVFQAMMEVTLVNDGPVSRTPSFPQLLLIMLGYLGVQHPCFKAKGSSSAKTAKGTKARNSCH